jgi:MSHA pilin protein MshC
VIHNVRGFSLIELITVMILIGIISIVLFSRVGSVGSASIQSSRDDVIAALFFAQQQAMMRPNISLVTTANSVSVRENGIPIQVASNYYPLAMPAGVSLSTVTLTYDRLGRTAATTITLTGSGSSAGISANIRVEATGYAFAQ